NDRVFEMRVGFNIDEEIEGLFAETEISFKDIREAVLPLAQVFLGDALTENLAAGADRLDNYVAKIAPGYRPILAHIPVDELAIDPAISDKDLDLLLHRHTYQVEQKLKSDGHDLMEPKAGESEDDYTKRLDQYLEMADDLKSSDLAKYVMHRKVVIDLLEKAIERNADGSFAREDVIHELIVPMQITSDDAKFKRQSLWLVDERLAFHNFLASDVPLKNQPITSNNTTKEPDISCLQIYENPLLVADTDRQHASLTVVELKRPMLKGSKPVEDEKKDPILQALNYLRRLREGATAKNGRPIPNADKIPGYVYVLADLTPHMINCCDIHQLTKT
ncbi:MAG: ATP-binding protein, partial [Lentilitoribacter sp.]